MGLSAEWLEKELAARGYSGAREVFLAVYGVEDGTLSVYPNE